MAEAISAKPSSLSPLTSPYSARRPFFVSKINSFPRRPWRSLHPLIFQCIQNQSTKTHCATEFSLFHPKPQNRNQCVSSRAESGQGAGETENVDEKPQDYRGESSMPSRFRYLTKEAPENPVRWPWLIALGVGIYAWRTVLWELSNWKKGALAIASFIGYLPKVVFAIIYRFIGPPITGLIWSIETALYTIRAIYSSIISSAPVQELTLIILLTSTLLAIAEAAVPDSANSQPYLLTLAGILGFGAVTDFIPELVFWLLLMGIFCFSRFYKKRDLVSSVLPVAAALTAVGQPWLRLVVMTSYVALAISHHSKKLSEGKTDVEAASPDRKLPVPLLVAAMTIGIHVAANWVRYRHLTWMIV